MTLCLRHKKKKLCLPAKEFRVSAEDAAVSASGMSPMIKCRYQSSFKKTRAQHCRRRGKEKYKERKTRRREREGLRVGAENYIPV